MWFTANHGDSGARRDDLLKNNAETEPAHEVFDTLPHRGSATGISKLLYSSVLADNRKPNMGFTLRYIEPNEDGSVRLEESDVQDLTKAVGFALIGYFAGKFPGRQAVSQICNGWKVKHRIHFDDSGLLVFRFDNEEDRNTILEGGPYYIWGRQLLLKQMPGFFYFGHHQFNSVPTWIQIYNLPIECWTCEALSKAISVVGRPLYSDKLTTTLDRISFARILVEVDISKELARILVEVDISKELANEIKVILPCGRVHIQQVVYEKKLLFCSNCKSIGHLKERCPHPAEANNSKVPGYFQSNASAATQKRTPDNSSTAIIQLAHFTGGKASPNVRVQNQKRPLNDVGNGQHNTPTAWQVMGQKNRPTPANAEQLNTRI